MAIENVIERTVYANKYAPTEPVYYVCKSNQQVLRVYLPDLLYSDSLAYAVYAIRRPDGSIKDSNSLVVHAMDNGGVYVNIGFSRGYVAVGENEVQLCFSYSYSASGTTAYSDVFTRPIKVIGIEEFTTPGWSSTT